MNVGFQMLGKTYNPQKKENFNNHKISNKMRKEKLQKILAQISMIL